MKSNGAGQELPQQGAIRLYVHIPFCVKKCSYCDFLSGPSCAEDRRRYLDALACEIANTRQEGAYVRSTFIGGGTPSVLETGQMEQLFSLLCFISISGFFRTPKSRSNAIPEPRIRRS